MRAVLLAACTLIGLTICTGAGASPITWHVTGEVDTGNQGDFFFPFTVSPGDAIAIDFTFESAVPCSFCEDTLRFYDNALIAMRFTVHDTAFVLPVDSSSIGIANDRPSGTGLFSDGFFLSSYGGPGAGLGLTFFSSLNWGNSASTLPVPGFDSVELANLQPPDPSLFGDSANGFWNFSAALDHGFDEFGGHFLTASAVMVPEPSTLALLASGTMLAWFCRYRRRSR